jgi:hypothetical protein
MRPESRETSRHRKAPMFEDHSVSPDEDKPEAFALQTNATITW